MTTTSSTIVGTRSSTGRGYFWLGLVLGVLSPFLYVAQLRTGRLFVPWYIPLLGTTALVLMEVALVRARSIWRFLGVGLLGLLAVGEWAFILTSKLPVYAGPV